MRTEKCLGILTLFLLLHDDPNDNEKERQLPENSGIIPEIIYLTVKEVQNEIACLNSRKASGIDGVTPIMLKEMSRKSLVLLTYVPYTYLMLFSNKNICQVS
jgi:hypothetical protein